MRKICQRLLALGLTAALLLPPAAAASLALGTEIHNATSTIGPGLTATKQTLWSATYADLRTEQYLTYTPGADVSPVVVYGSNILSRSTLTAMAKELEGAGRRVLGGINGDYFVVATGAPLGLVVTDGVLRSSASYHHAVGFLPDGTAFAGQPNLSIRAAFHGSVAGISGVNKVREAEGGFFLFTPDFGPNTQNSSPGIDVILVPRALWTEPEETPETGDSEGEVPETEVPEEELPETEVPGADAPEGETPETEESSVTYDLTIGGQVEYVVEAVLQSQREIAIPPGRVVLSINLKSNADAVAAAAALAVGDAVAITVESGDPRWGEAVYAVGGMHKLVTNGIVASGLEQTMAPRTAIGITPDGGTILYTIDGRRAGHSVGASVEQVAKRLVELGCVEAILLDGGGSTTFGTTAAVENSFAVTSRPSEGSARAVTNAIFFVSNLEPTGEAASLQVYPGDAMLLSGASIDLRAIAIDSGYYPMWPVNGVRYSAGAGGVVDAAGRLTVSGPSGVVTVTAEAGYLRGTGHYTVVDTPDRIDILDEATGHEVTAINLEQYESVDLTAAAIYRKLDLLSDDGCYTWSVSPEIGTVDEHGVLTAGANGASGTLTVTAGERTVAIPVSVAGHVLPLEDFEGTFDTIIGTDSAELFAEGAAAYVRYGRGSMGVTYTIPEADRAVFLAPIALVAGESYLGLWVHGDGSGNLLTASLTGADGAVEEMLLTTLDFVGWHQVMVPLPLGATALRAMMIEPGDGEVREGTIRIDQMVSANQYVIDAVPPEISLTVSGGVISATAHDDVDRSIAAERVRLTYDGADLEFFWDAGAGALTAAPPDPDGAAHRLTLTVGDVSGNLGRASADIPRTSEGEPPFTDIAGHWAREHAEYLWNLGISNGQMQGEARVYLPDNDITRAEFTVMVARWLGLDLAQYESMELPFVDAEDIPGWAKSGIAAMYAAGVFQGSFQGDGVYAFANNTITRAEAMTILGRIQAKGYPSVEADFADAADIPVWAVDYVCTLVAQGVVSGYDGLLRPGDPLRRGEVAKLLYTLH